MLYQSDAGAYATAPQHRLQHLCPSPQCSCILADGALKRPRQSLRRKGFLCCRPRQEISTKQETYTDTNVNVDTTRGLDVPATEST